MTGMCPHSRHHMDNKETMTMEQWLKTFEVWREYVERLERDPQDGVALLLEKHYAKVLDQLRSEMIS